LINAGAERGQPVASDVPAAFVEVGEEQAHVAALEPGQQVELGVGRQDHDRPGHHSAPESSGSAGGAAGASKPAPSSLSAKAHSTSSSPAGARRPEMHPYPGIKRLSWLWTPPSVVAD
jgi:hypothetical protein